MSDSTGQFRHRLRMRLAAGRRTIGLAGALALALFLLLAVLERPTPASWSQAAAGGNATVSVLTFNILTGGMPAADALAAIASADADIVCLQELTPALASDFARQFGDRYPHRIFEPRAHTQGIGIASRYPLSHKRILTLGLPYLPAAAAAVMLPQGRLQVACVHLMPPHSGFGQADDLLQLYRDNRAVRIGQARRLLAHLDAAGGPAVLLGDFNEWPGQAALATAHAAGFTDACHASGSRCGPTWPGRLLPLPALFRIDHILGRDVAFSHAAVLEAGGSDHYPVAARVAFEPERVAERGRR